MPRQHTHCHSTETLLHSDMRANAAEEACIATANADATSSESAILHKNINADDEGGSTALGATLVPTAALHEAPFHTSRTGHIYLTSCQIQKQCTHPPIPSCPVNVRAVLCPRKAYPWYSDQTPFPSLNAKQVSRPQHPNANTLHHEYADVTWPPSILRSSFASPGNVTRLWPAP